MIEKDIKHRIQASISLKNKVKEDVQILARIEEVVNQISEVLTNSKKVLLAGNGGSAADALHLAAEFSGRFYLNRKALPVEALNVNEAALTAIANDYGFEQLFARLVESKGTKGDLLWLFSTSGKSVNIINAAKKAKEMGLKLIGFTGEVKTELDDYLDIAIKIPSKDTPRIQECHLMIGHIICEFVEKNLFNE